MHNLCFSKCSCLCTYLWKVTTSLCLNWNSVEAEEAARLLGGLERFQLSLRCYLWSYSWKTSKRNVQLGSISSRSLPYKSWFRSVLRAKAMHTRGSESESPVRRWRWIANLASVYLLACLAGKAAAIGEWGCIIYYKLVDLLLNLRDRARFEWDLVSKIASCVRVLPAVTKRSCTFV